MKRLNFLFLSIALFFTLLYPAKSAAVMEDYCTAPPYVIQNVPPNVMVILDNSGSMFNFAYFDGYNTTTTADDNMCTASGTPCTGYLTPGAYPAFKFYGYFNPDYWYEYTSNRFVPTTPKNTSGLSGGTAKAANEWDGNFLNWLAMRRVDVARKVLTGGRYVGGEGSGFDRLRAERADGSSRGIYKQIANIENYAPTTFSGTRCITFSTGGAATSTFDVGNSASCPSASGGGPYNVAVRVPTPVQGVIQDVGTRVRLGLTFYNTSEGGRVVRDIRGSNCAGGNSLPCVVNDINNTNPSTWTPLGETLWTVTGYFAQQASIAGGPGPRYAAGDFTINNNNDPFNYGTGGQPTYPVCSKSYVLLITDGEPCNDGNLPDPSIEEYATGKSIFNCTGTNCPAAGPFPAQTIPACTGNVAGIEDVALYAHTTDLRNSPTLGSNNISGTQNLTLYVVSAFGRGSTLLRYAAINGGFEDSNANNQPDLQSEWDNNSDNEPDTYYEADEGYSLEAAIKSAFSNMISRVSSGTAVSVLSSREGQGSSLIQGVFYPRRRFGNDIINWTGALQNLWYYTHPRFTYMNIREDTDRDKMLDLRNDYIIQFYFDPAPTLQKTMARRFSDTDGNGGADTQLLSVAFEELNSLWEAGFELWKRNANTSASVNGNTVPLSAAPRTIYTTINQTSFLPGNFTTGGNTTILAPYMDVPDVNGGGNTLETEYIIRYIHGEDGLVTVDIDENGTNDYLGVDLNGDGVDDYRSRYVRMYNDATGQIERKIWKLGDILNSTPKIASWRPINTYDKGYPKYDDSVYKEYYNTVAYMNRNIVFAGANDGMLHAFKLGTLEGSWAGYDPIYQKARLTGSDLGKEMWGFIPKNALPYLKYIADPDYCHIYTVDLTPYLVDASVNGSPTGANTINSWWTILIGGMRAGGASRGTTTACNGNPSGSSIGKDCVNTPVDVSGESIGYSSYFALKVGDITQSPENPEFLWEFSHPELGFATSGPAVVRVGGDKTVNGSWFVVFGSGPTGPISTQDTQFMGRSDQNLKFFIFDLRTGPGVNNSNVTILDTGIPYAFAGNMVNSTIDPDVDYQDDAIYVGYTNRNTSDGAGNTTNPYKWTQGGIGKIVTNESTNPATWVWRPLMTNIGPVTAAAPRLQKDISKSKPENIWVYFGAGRNYYAIGNEIDDPANQRRLFGIKEPCASGGMFNPGCATTVAVASLYDVTLLPLNTTEPPVGWYINLDSAGNYSYCEAYDGSGNCTQTSTRAYGSERILTDPVVSPNEGTVYFTSYKPYNDTCALGGKTFSWAMLYNAGGAPQNLIGKILLQVSTGSIEEVDKSTAFANRKSTVAIEGVPSTEPPTIISQPQAVGRILHIRER
ncbi:MAG: hypothetical protein HZC10_04005 [Nitrospirae bacterium]|nr:hypothetical protein [Nitrospirota bacterium]